MTDDIPDGMEPVTHFIRHYKEPMDVLRRVQDAFDALPPAEAKLAGMCASAQRGMGDELYVTDAFMTRLEGEGILERDPEYAAESQAPAGERSAIRRVDSSRPQRRVR